MARAGGVGSRARIGRTPPTVTLAGGTIAASTLLTDGSTDAVAVPVSPARDGRRRARARARVPPQPRRRYGIDLAEIGERARLTGSAGDVYVLQLPRPVGSSVVLPWAELPPRLVLVGVGAGRPDDLRRAGAALARATRGLRRVVTTLGAEAQQTASQAAAAARAVAEGYLLAAYAPLRITSNDETKDPAELVLLGRDGTRAAAAVAAARTAATATWLVRDLATTPSNTKNPAVDGRAGAPARRRGRARGRRPRAARARRVRRDPGGRCRVRVAAPAGHRRLHARDVHAGLRQARRGRRQGHHLRHRRPVDQAERRHGADEDGHDRCRRRAGHRARRRRGRGRAPGHRRAAAGREPRRRATPTGPATC